MADSATAAKAKAGQGPAGGAQKARASATPAGGPPIPLGALAALGVVFGDLGTSPLYTLQTVVGAVGGRADPQTALGVLSLVVWTLLISISLKYCFFVMRADNQGEGGILALMSLVGMNDWRRGTFLGASMGLLGAALIYGDGVITPSISVLSALEGVNIVTTILKPFIVPLTVLILAGLFAAQRFGTAVIGRAFGPVMLLWFVVIAVLGLLGVLRHPVVLEALDPLHGLTLLVRTPGAALAILGGVFLCATGGEALYADMGHFGRLPIRLAWYAVALPALLLSYAGQTGAMIDGIPKGANPFFVIAPHWAVIPLVILATLATIIASQAIITGAFSMTRQAMQLGWLPGVEIRQTSDKVYGQIYVPAVNALMAVGTILITLTFQSSDRLAGAYGTAVSTTMVLTTFLLIRAMSRTWRWSPLIVAPIGGLFLVVDLGFFVANLAKIVDGGWIPLSLGAAIYGIMVTWRTGVQSLRAQLAALTETVPTFLNELDQDKITRVPGAAVFLTRPTDRVPSMMLQTARQMGSLHKVLIALHLKFEEQPRVADDKRWSVEKVAEGFWRVTLCYGFIEAPNVEQALREAPGLPKDMDWDKAVFFTARDVVLPEAKHGLGRLRIKIFSFFFKNAARLTDRFNLPPERTIEVARLVQI